MFKTFKFYYNSTFKLFSNIQRRATGDRILENYELRVSVM